VRSLGLSQSSPTSDLLVDLSGISVMICSESTAIESVGLGLFGDDISC
jgi:hypothetical protein